MNHRISLLVATAAVLAWTTPALGVRYILSDQFTGDEDEIQNLFEEGPPEMLPYHEYGPINVSASGSYQLTDARNTFRASPNEFDAADITVSVFSAPFNPNNPQQNHVGTVDDNGSLQFSTGTDYHMVVQPYDPATPIGDFGFGMVIDGPGDVSGESTAQLPSHFFSRFDGNEALALIIPEWYAGPNDCPETYHDMTGPHQFEQTGFRYVGALSALYDNPMPLAVGIYESGFDPNDPFENQVAIGPNWVEFFAEAGKKYYYVLQPDCDLRTGPWAIVVTAQNPAFAWSSLMSTALYDSNTPGQGMLLDVYTRAQLVFLAWFTFRNELPDPGDMTDVGAPGQAWMVALGPYEEVSDTVIEMDVFAPEGGLFNDPMPVDQPIVGSMTLDLYNGCEGGEARYELDSGPQGTVPLGRIANDTLRDCFDLTAAPGPYTD